MATNPRTYTDEFKRESVRLCLTVEEEKIRQLEHELAVVQQTRDVLKKAVVIFSNPKT